MSWWVVAAIWLVAAAVNGWFAPIVDWPIMRPFAAAFEWIIDRVMGVVDRMAATWAWMKP